MDPLLAIAAFSSLPEAGRWAEAAIVPGTETPLGVATPTLTDGRWFVEAAIVKVSRPIAGGDVPVQGSPPGREDDHGCLLMPATIFLPALHPLRVPGIVEADYGGWVNRRHWREIGVRIKDVFPAVTDRRERSKWTMCLDRTASRQSARRRPATVLVSVAGRRRALALEPWALLEPTTAGQAALRGSQDEWLAAEHRAEPVRARLQDEHVGAGRPPELLQIGGYERRSEQELSAFMALQGLGTAGQRRRLSGVLRSPATYAALLADPELAGGDLQFRADRIRDTANTWNSRSRRAGSLPTRIDHQDHARVWVSGMPPLLHVARVALSAWLASDAFALVAQALRAAPEMTFEPSPFLGSASTLAGGRVPFAWASVELGDRSEETYLRLMREGLDVTRIEPRTPDACTRLRVGGFDGRDRRGLGDALRDAGLVGDVIEWSDV
ncbi:hypothetical protein LBMAG42_55560 [Deltaproteobacteria bacterium]|nr:hypothetical protein LBMAG42_55560 [Deltaproteobacteria bacterium]